MLQLKALKTKPQKHKFCFAWVVRGHPKSPVGVNVSGACFFV